MKSNIMKGMKFKITDEDIEHFIKQHEIKGSKMNGCKAIKGNFLSYLIFMHQKHLIVLADDKSTTVITLDNKTHEPIKTVKYWFSEIKNINITKGLTQTIVKIQFKYDKKIILKITEFNQRANDVIQKFKNLKNKFLNDKSQSKYYR